jgi:hypothetical protein
MQRYLLLGSVVVILLATASTFWSARRSEDLPPELEDVLQLRNLPPNRWVKYFESRPGAWSRQGHAGMAFDTRRGSLLIFGSDTHGVDWDNAVHEFQPRLKRWETHYTAVGPESYRVDEVGRPVAGSRRTIVRLRDMRWRCGQPGTGTVAVIFSRLSKPLSRRRCRPLASSNQYRWRLSARAGRRRLVRKYAVERAPVTLVDQDLRMRVPATDNRACHSGHWECMLRARTVSFRGGHALATHPA